MSFSLVEILEDFVEAARTGQQLSRVHSMEEWRWGRILTLREKWRRNAVAWRRKPGNLEKQRAWMARLRKDPAYREKQRAWMKAYRKRKKA